jgi:2-desacetyl-2-hydroxyethyl bacteriochlorophyllide A dehydrogenase
MNMKALMYMGPRNMEIVEVPEIYPKQGEVKIAIKSSGICGSDTHGYLGTTGRRTAPMIMGHEAAGEVVELGSGVTKFAVGDRVVVFPIKYCGHCEYCLEHLENICANRTFLGTMSENGTNVDYICSKESLVIHLPEGMSYEYGAMIEPFAVAFRAVSQAMPLQGKTVMIIGSGPIGLLILMIARQRGAEKIIVSDLVENRLRLALDLGADYVVNAAKGDLGEQLKQHIGSDKVDITIEAVGISPTVQQSVNYLKNKGTAVWVGNSEKLVQVGMQEIVTRELTVKGTYIYSEKDFIDAMHLMADGKFDMSKLISATIPLEKADDMFKTLTGGPNDYVKVIVAW